MVGSAKVRRRGIYTLFFSLLGAPGGDICSGCVWHMCPQPWPKVAWDSELNGGTMAGGGGERAAKESWGGTRMGLPAPFSPLRGQSLGSSSSHSDHVLRWPKISFSIAFMKKPERTLWHTRYLFCQSVQCAGQPANTREVVGTVQAGFQVPRCPRYDGGGTGRRPSPRSQVGGAVHPG